MTQDSHLDFQHVLSRVCKQGPATKACADISCAYDGPSRALAERLRACASSPPSGACGSAATHTPPLPILNAGTCHGAARVPHPE
eukprot:3083975-Pleurochrysis_carterae.AAC.2